MTFFSLVCALQLQVDHSAPEASLLLYYDAVHVVPGAVPVVGCLAVLVDLADLAVLVDLADLADLDDLAALADFALARAAPHVTFVAGLVAAAAVGLFVAGHVLVLVLVDVG